MGVQLTWTPAAADWQGPGFPATLSTSSHPRRWILQPAWNKSFFVVTMAELMMLHDQEVVGSNWNGLFSFQNFLHLMSVFKKVQLYLGWCERLGNNWMPSCSARLAEIIRKEIPPPRNSAWPGIEPRIFNQPSHWTQMSSRVVLSASKGFKPVWDRKNQASFLLPKVY